MEKFLLVILIVVLLFGAYQVFVKPTITEWQLKIAQAQAEQEKAKAEQAWAEVPMKAINSLTLITIIEKAHNICLSSSITLLAMLGTAGLVYFVTKKNVQTP